jgi:2-amino-4-hydroxy-6-hydroxymethyldihydropteridine diphosphokinase
MEQVVVAVGSNLGDRLAMVKKAGIFLEKLSGSEIVKSSIWESEPVGGARYTFYNAAAVISTELQPTELLRSLKEFETKCGREKNYARWSPRILDLDIITFGNLVIETDNLIIPHPEYKKRLFVLLPMKEICPNQTDSSTHEPLGVIIKKAPEIEIHKTELEW